MNFLKKSHLLTLSLVLSPLMTSTAFAGDESPSFLSFSHENDNLGGGTDRYYTSGARVTYFDAGIEVPPVIDELADHIPTFDLNETTSVYYTLGQNLYTPANIKLAAQPENDRPWAGFLYGSVGLTTATYNEDETRAHIDDLEFTLGIIGPEALGEQTQKFVHKYISNSPKPMGWNNQLGFEPGFIVTWSRRVPYALRYDLFDDINFRVEPNYTIALGTIRTYAGAGATMVLASSKSMDTPTRVRPAIPGTGAFNTNDRDFNWQIFAGLDGRLVGRDIFLDGNTFRDSHSVDKKYLVGDASAGVSFTYDDYRLSYTLNKRTKEFDEQEKGSVFGSVTLTTRF